MALTDKPREGLLMAAAAPCVTLSRCARGYYDKTRNDAPQTAPVVTTRTAITLVDMGLAEFNDPDVPSSFTLTPLGIRTAQHELQALAA